MTIVVPVPITPAGLPLPDPADRATFSARKLEQLRWANNEYSTGSLALANASLANAQDAQVSATTADAKAVSAATSAALAAGYAGATLWVSGTAYALGAAVRSPLDGRIYRRIFAGAGTTDPSADPTNWKIDNNAPLLRKDVAGTAQAGLAGYDYWATNVAATTLTLPASPLDGDSIAFTCANGRKDNAIDSGAITVRGPAGSASGVITLNQGARMQLTYSTLFTVWVVVS